MSIFISYRRSDTQDFAGRLADRLRSDPDIEEVFLDVDNIDPGEIFETKLRAALTKCQVFLAVIGPDWIGSTGTLRRARIFDPGDTLRLEIRLALESQMRIIPVLANAAVMPSIEKLPYDIRDLTKLNATSVRHSDFDRDVDHLLGVMFARRSSREIRGYLARHPAQAGLLRSLLGFCLAGTMLILFAVAHYSVTGRSLDQSFGGPGPTIIVICTILVGGTLMPGIISRIARRRISRRPNHDPVLTKSARQSNP
jgi:hypothetical protein